MPVTVFTPSGVRLRQHSSRPGPLNWLLLPGGPGLGSESLQDLATALTVPGTVWLVDLPEDGSNRCPPGAAAPPYANWPQVIAEAAQALPDVVFAGHSTGGMYLLSTPALECHILGLVLLDTAADASWHTRFVDMAREHPLPAVIAANALYEADRSDAHLAAVAVAAAEWNFSANGLALGRQLLSGLPYNRQAVEWSDAHFDHVYAAQWWPRTLPVLLLAGSEDRIVWQGGWDHPRFNHSNVLRRTIPGGGHFPWIENPCAVDMAFHTLAAHIRRPGV